MDEKPFAEINLFDLKSAPLKEIKQMSKAMYDIDISVVSKSSSKQS
jgi:hypothetical protein